MNLQINQSQLYAEVQLPRSGLGNQLFVWGRAVKFCLENDARLLTPIFVRAHVGPILRRESDLRFYIGLFRPVEHKEVSGYRKVATKIISKSCAENEWGSEYVDSHSRRPTRVVFRRTSESFELLNGYNQELRERLYEMTKERWLNKAKDVGEVPIGMHVRLGDFSGSIRHPISWYVDAVHFVRAIAGEVPIAIFSDGSDAELAELLALPSTRVIRTGSAVSDLIALSRSRFLIGTGSSTFSAWAAYLGQMPAFTRMGNSFSWLSLENTDKRYIGEWNPESSDEKLIREIKGL